LRGVAEAMLTALTATSSAFGAAVVTDGATWLVAVAPAASSGVVRSALETSAMNPQHRLDPLLVVHV
jgi:hypothetical protein